MEKADFDEYINKRYINQIHWYDKKAGYYHTLYIIIQWNTIIFSALTPVLIEMQINLPTYQFLKMIPIITSVIVAILTAAIKTFGFQEYWVSYRTTAETLKKELYIYRACADDYANIQDKEALFVQRVENLISREHTMWLDTSTSEEKEKG